MKLYQCDICRRKSNNDYFLDKGTLFLHGEEVEGGGYESLSYDICTKCKKDFDGGIEDYKTALLDKLSNEKRTRGTRKIEEIVGTS